MQRDIRSGGYKLNAEIIPEHLDLLKEKSRQLSMQIMQQEEAIILDNFDDAAILRMRDLIHAQIISRGIK